MGVTKMHVLCTYDTVTGKYTRYEHQTLLDCLKVLSEADELIGHNIIGYDLPALNKLYGLNVTGKVRDTLVWARLVYGDIKTKDMGLWKAGRLPGQLIGRHSLESYGYRLGVLKGDYSKGKTAEDAWAVWSPEMSDYCEQDVAVTVALHEKLKGIETSEEALQLEHDVATIIQRQVAYGWQFNVTKGWKLYAEIMSLRENLKLKLQGVFPPFWLRDGKDVTPKKDIGPPKAKNSKTLHEWIGADGQLLKARALEGCSYTKIKLVEFNPSSRDHIANRLKHHYKWQPVEFTEDGKTKVDETVLSNLPYPEAKLLSEYLMLDKRIGQLGDGKEAWLRCVSPEGRIFGNVNPSGAVTRRMTHSKPNVAQVPAVSKNKAGEVLLGIEGGFGAECRELFEVRPGCKLVGGDASGLELRCLGHYMARWDDGAYIKVILEGDIHSVNQQAAQLSTRDKAKTFIYAFLYGAGDELLGVIAVEGDGKVYNSNQLRKIGRELRQRFTTNLQALGSLIDAAKAKVKQGFVFGLDGGKIPIRHEHAALNTLLQSAGALVMKKALVILDGKLKALGLQPFNVADGTGHYEFVGNIHDEFQLEVLEQHAELVGKTIVESIRAAGEHFNFRCPLDGEYKIGNNWKETH